MLNREKPDERNVRRLKISPRRGSGHSGLECRPQLDECRGRARGFISAPRILKIDRRDYRTRLIR